jgi:lysophospholipase L1-like esterase
VKWWLVVVAVLSGLSEGWGQFCGQNHSERIAQVHETADVLMGDKPNLVLTGSSSIRMWPGLDAVFPEHDVVNAGFGGSCFSDLWKLRDTLIYTLHPDVLFIYEGDNDLSDGVDPDSIMWHASLLLDEVGRRLPLTRVVVIAPKPSIARRHLSQQYISLNHRLRTAAMNQGASWVNFWDAQHHPDGQLREDLFVQDGLHLNRKGYAVWVDELRRQVPWLIPSK